MQRTVIVRGFKPLGGASWWPGMGIHAAPLFGGKCAPANGSILTPAHNPKIIREDLKTLRKFINNPQEVNANTSSDANDLTELLKRYCEE